MMRMIVFGLAILWVILVVASVVAFQVTAPTDFGLTRGLNRVTVFFGWQIGALVTALLAAIAWLSAKPPKGGLMRVAGFGPIVLSGALVLLVVGLVLYLRLDRPLPADTPPSDPRPVTAPAEPAPNAVDPASDAPEAD